MRLFPRDADFSAGLDLGLLGLIAMIVGGYVKSVSAPPTESYSGLTEVTLVQLAGVLPAPLGRALFWIGALLAVGAPLVFWIGWPLYLKMTR